MNQQIIDHGKLDYLTPKPSSTDQAIAHQIRCSLSLVSELRGPDSLAQQMIRNGLSALDDPFAWLRA